MAASSNGCSVSSVSLVIIWVFPISGFLDRDPPPTQTQRERQTRHVWEEGPVFGIKLCFAARHVSLMFGCFAAITAQVQPIA
eukprot:1203555-Amphidinium_carterae.2